MTNLLKLNYFFLATWLLLINSALTHAADLTFTPVAPVVEVGEKITLTVSGTTGQITWSAQKGWIIGVGNEVTYQAPDQAGFDVVLVSDAAGNIGTVKIQVVAKSNISQENAVWEVFTNRSVIYALLLSDDDNTLWVGTAGGLEKRDAKTGEIQQVFYKKDGLPDNNIGSLLNDGQGGLWIGTFEGGLVHYTKEQWQVFNTGNSDLPNNNVRHLLNDGQDGLWIGTNGGGLAHYTAQGQWQIFRTDNSDLPSDDIGALFSNGPDELWIGTKKGLAYYNTSQGEWRVFNKENSGLPGDNVSAITKGAPWELLVGFHCGEDGDSQCVDGGLVSYNQWTEQWTKLGENFQVTALFVNNSNTFEEKSSWLGTFGSLLYVQPQKEPLIFGKDSFIMVSEIIGDGQGGVWVGTGSGLIHYTANGDEQLFSVATVPLMSTTLLNDNKGNLWVGGASVLVMGTDNFLVYRSPDGQWHNPDEIEFPLFGIIRVLEKNNLPKLRLKTNIPFRQMVTAYYLMLNLGHFEFGQFNTFFINSG